VIKHPAADRTVDEYHQLGL